MHLHNMKSNSYLMYYTKVNINIRCRAIQFLNSNRENILYMALGSEAQKGNRTKAFPYRKTQQKATVNYRRCLQVRKMK